MSVVKSLSEVRDATTNMTIEEIAQHAKSNDDREAIIIEELKSHLDGLL